MKTLRDITALLFLVVLCIVGTMIVAIKFKGYIKLAPGERIVTAEAMNEIDSLMALPPEIVSVIEYQDTGSIKIVYHDPPAVEPDPIDSTLFTVRDSLHTDFFEVSHKLGLQLVDGSLSVRSSKWSQRYFGPKTILTSYTKYVPSIVDNEVPVPAQGFYIGVSADASKYLYSYGINGDLVKGRFVYGGYIHKQQFFGIDQDALSFGARISYKLFK